MNPGNMTKQYDEFVFRRLTEPVPLLGFNLPAQMWVFVLALVLLVGFIYVGIMYLRDSRGVGILWAGLLGLLRVGVYAAVAFIFLLPSRQTWEETTTTSKVVVLFDVSGSMTMTRDEIPKEGQDPKSIPTRGDLVRRLVTNPDVNFFGRLQKKNPVTVYRFGRFLDEEPLYLADGKALTKAEKALRDDKLKEGAVEVSDLPEPLELTRPFLDLWMAPNPDPNAAAPAAPADFGQQDQKRWEYEVARAKTLAENRMPSDTNLGDAVLSAVNREFNNMVQGIVIFTDGRSTEGSGSAFEEIKKRARAANPPIPVFVVGIGQERLQTRIEITDVRAPQQVQPEDRWRVVMEVTGDGLAEEEIPAYIVIRHTRKTADGKEEVLPIIIREQDDTKAPKKDEPKKPDDKKPDDKKPDDKKPGDKKKGAEINLGEELILRPEKMPKFDRSNPPRVEIEYAIDAAALAKAAGKADDAEFKNKKWEIGETPEDAALRIQAVVPRNKHEVFDKPEHKSDVVDVRVRKRPIRVLMFASAANHDFQFLNALMLREVGEQKAEMSVYVQPPPGKDAKEWLEAVVFGVKKDRLLSKFPDKFDQPAEKPEEKVYDLTEYDVIVAFDPDWTKLTPEQLKLVKTWVDKGGGLVMVGGPIHTIQLARPGPNKEKLEPVRELLPVILKDVRIEALDRTTENPWPLDFPGATPEMEFLKLSEDPNIKFLDDWKEFFHGKEKAGPVKRGFFNYYPTEQVRTGSIVVATFDDPRAKMKNGDKMPYIVISPPGSPGRVVWIAWGETRRLRQWSEAFHERFWTKLVRYAGANNQTNLATRIKLDLGRSFPAGRFVQMGAEISGPGGEPLMPRKDADLPKVKLTLPAGVPPNEIPTEYKMTARKVREESDKGKFSLRFQVKSPGEYQVELKVPETGDTKTQKFLVKESNPELDNTKPDFQAMWDLAGDAEEVLGRMPEDRRQVLKARLLASAPKFKDEKDKPDRGDVKAPGRDGKMRLYFDLESAQMIPDCMTSRVDTKQNKGPYKDVWDGDWDVLGIFETLHIPSWLRNGLAVIVGLLSLEWLIRKLLRLA